MGLQNYQWRKSPTGLALLASLIVSICLAPAALADKSASDLQITLDATDISRKLVQSTITINRGDDSLSVLFPKWIPGLHGPCGPIENLAGFKAFDHSGAPVPWERDFADPFRFNVHSSATQHPVTVTLSYICNQPTTISWGSDCASTPTLAVINWNTVSVYPEGSIARDLMVEPRLILPGGWKYATAMPVKESRGDTLVFETITYEELIDFPVVCGLYLKTLQLETTSSADYFVHVVVDEEVLLPLVDSAFTDPSWSRLIHETEELFGRTHFDTYHFLVPISDSIPQYGLEHRNSSVNSGSVKTLKEYGKTHYFLQWVLPHEFVHAWCGKYRRPAGMSTRDYQTPKNMELLWVYEGLTEYLGMVLTARSGLMSEDYFKEELALYWGNLRHMAGRDWRSLRDIAVSTYTVWGSSDSWAFRRRAADYYSEGSMLWLEVDARIRQITNGERSLDDFCKSFFGAGDRDTHSIPYDQSDLVSTLSELAAFNWDSLFTVRISSVRHALDETPLDVAGHEFHFTENKPKAVSNEESRDECRYYYESIGFAVAEKDNRVLQVVPGSPGDIAGIYTGMSVLGVNGKTFSFDRLDKAITDAANTGELVLLTQHGEALREHTIHYRDGLRYMSLQPIEGRKNWLDVIIEPMAQH